MIDSLLFWLLLLFVSNLILIVIFWNNYGSRIQFLISRKEEKEFILDAKLLNSNYRKNIRRGSETMANAIKEFFNKKKIDAKFKMAGSGHRLADSASASTSASTSGSSTSVNTSGENRNEPKSGRKDMSTQKAAEAAIERIQRQQTNSSKSNTLENILQEERQRISEESKMKERVESLVKEEEKMDKKLAEMETKQRFSCPAIGLNEFQTLDVLIEQISDYIQNNFSEDLTLMSVLTIFNCNYNLNDDCKQLIDDCIKTLDKVVTNLGNSSPEEREKFKKIRKNKIEKRVLSLKGGLEFLISIGFESDSDGEWLIFRGDETNASEQMSYYKDVLNSVQPFPLVLDRQCVVLQHNQKQTEDLTSDFFKLSTDELMREYQTLAEKKELEETLRTKAMREQRHRKIVSKFSRLRFKFPNGDQIEATFKSSETMSDVKNWLFERFDGLKQFDLKCVRDVFTDEHMNKTLLELDLMPTATLLIISKDT